MADTILRERPLTAREAVIPYFMAGVNMLAATLTGSGMLLPMVLLVAITFIVIGLPCSYYFRQRRYHYIWLNVLFMGPLLLVAWALVRNHPGMQINWFDATSVMTSDVSIEMELLLNALVILATGRSFVLVTSREMLQTPIPSFSILLLAVIIDATRGTFHVATSFMCLLTLFISSLYLFSQEHSQAWFAIHTPLRVQKQLVKWAIGLTLIIFPFAFALGLLLQPINMQSLAEARRNSRMPGLSMPSFFNKNTGLSFPDTLEVGGARWPTGNQRIMQVMVEGGPADDLLWRGATYSTYHDGNWGSDWDQSETRYIPDIISGNEVRLDKPIVRRPTHNPPPPPSTDSDNFAHERISASIDPGISTLTKTMSLRDAQFKKLITPVTQTITLYVQVNGRAPVYGAYEIMHIRASDADAARNISLSGAGDGNFVMSSYSYLPPRPYTVTSYIKAPPSRFPPLKDARLSDDELKEYLQMPDDAFRSAISAKAQEILKTTHTAQLNPRSMMLSFYRYLGTNYKYTLTPKPPRRGEDPTIDFLYNQKQGYCNYFSSAMVMLCRSMNIPARIAVGFATGEIDEKLSNDRKTVYTVTSEHAHSWAEVFLPGYGWYTIDPTAGSTKIPSTWESFWDNVTSFINRMKDIFAGMIATINGNAKTRALTSMAIIFLLMLTAGYFFMRRERPPVMPKQMLSEEESRQVVISAYQRMQRWLGKWGFPKGRGMTAGEYERHIKETDPRFAEPVHSLSQLYVRAEYAACPLYDRDARNALTLLRELWEIGRTEKAATRKEPPPEEE